MTETFVVSAHLDDAPPAEIDAVRCYATQLRQLVEGFGDFITPAGLGLEVYWPRR